jgi:hypothetical protein
MSATRTIHFTYISVSSFFAQYNFFLYKKVSENGIPSVIQSCLAVCNAVEGQLIFTGSNFRNFNQIYFIINHVLHTEKV